MDHELKDLIEYSDLEKLDFRVGYVESASKKEGSDKLLRLIVDFGAKIGIRTIYTAMAKYYNPEHFIGKKTVFLVNIKPKKIMGEDSFGMIFAIEGPDGAPVLLSPEKDLPQGALVI